MTLSRPGEVQNSGRAGVADPATWTISNEHMRVVLASAANGGLASLVDLRTGRDFVAAPRPLYELLLFEKGREPVELSSLDADSLDVERIGSPKGESLLLTYGPHGGLDIRVMCRVELEAGSRLSTWRVSIDNGTSYGVRAIRFPVIVAPTVLGESVEDDCFVSGIFGGTMTHRPGEDAPLVDRAEFRAKGGRDSGWMPVQYPGFISMQMQAYYDDLAGLYMAAYDDAGTVKRFGLTRLEDGLDISIEHSYDERAGLSFDLPYQTVLGVFHGDWYTAADIYKAWAEEQHWCARKIVERTDLPAWIIEPRPWMAIISRGNYARLRGILNQPPAEWPIGKFWPAKKVVPLMREYADILNTPVVTWMEGWEKIGAPGGPVDIFPPLEGEETFRAAMAELYRDGNLPFMYLAGFHWCYKRPTVGYDDWERFEKEGRSMAALDDRGELMISDISARTYGDGQKYFVSLCTGSEGTQKLFLDNFLRLMDLGAVAVQMDQQLGFHAQVCYSDEHGHPPGYGPWMYDATLDFVRQVRRATRERDPDAILGLEMPCEVWIQELDIAFHRPYGVGRIPLYDYVYHEYTLAYGGDDRMDLSHPEVSLMKHATLAAYGLQNCVGIGEAEYDIEVNREYPALVLLRSICQAQRTYARDYLVLGRMIRPTTVGVSTEEVDLYGRPGTVHIPTVVHSMWQAPNGKVGHILINWTGVAEEVTLSLAREQGTVTVVTADARKEMTQREIQNGTVTRVVPPRGVMLVEQE